MRIVCFIAAMVFLTGCASVQHQGFESVKTEKLSFDNASFSEALLYIANTHRLISNQTSIVQMVDEDRVIYFIPSPYSQRIPPEAYPAENMVKCGPAISQSYTNISLSQLLIKLSKQANGNCQFTPDWAIIQVPYTPFAPTLKQSHESLPAPW